MGDPRKTGISSVTDRIVYVRHAAPMEREFVGEQLARRGGAALDLMTADIVVAAEDERIIGFAVLQRSAGDNGTACLALVEERRRKGIGRTVLRHLLEHAEASKVLAGTESTRYLKSAGFHRVSGQRRKPRRSGGCAMRGETAGSAALYERAQSGERSELQQ